MEERISEFQEEEEYTVYTGWSILSIEIIRNRYIDIVSFKFKEYFPEHSEYKVQKNRRPLEFLRKMR